MKLIAGNSNHPLAQEIATHLKLPLSDTIMSRFPDNEIRVEIKESVRGEDVFIIQSTSAPVNDHLMELLVTLDALKRGSARRVTAVIPYFGYARQDRKSSPRAPISAKLVADLLTAAGAHRVLTLDLHAGQIQGFFNIPVDNLFVSSLFGQDLLQQFGPEEADKITIVSPDVGGVVRARSIAKRIKADLAIIDKRRQEPGKSEVMNVVGQVADKICVITDDIVDSGGTLCNAAQALMDAGATKVHAYVSHGVLSGACLEKIMTSPLESFVVTNSINISSKAAACPKIKTLSVAPLIGEAIRRTHQEASVSCLFD